MLRKSLPVVLLVVPIIVVACVGMAVTMPWVHEDHRINSPNDALYVSVLLNKLGQAILFYLGLIRWRKPFARRCKI